MARERAEELVRLVVDLYGAGLERLLEIVHEAGRLDDDLLDRLVADDLVASLLAVHGLHPDDVGTRVARALDGVRPYLGSHGGDVELVGVTDDGRVRLRMLGSCDGCPSSSVTLTLAVESAIRDAAPEVSGIDVEEAAGASSPSVIPVTALRSRLDAAPAGEWTHVPGFADLASGEVGWFAVEGMAVTGVRVGADLYAYRDACPVCGGSLGMSTVARRLGGAAGDAVLRCPGVRRALRRPPRGPGAGRHGGAPGTGAPARPGRRRRARGAQGGGRMTTTRPENPLDVLRRIRATRPAPSAEERCEMCAEPIGEQHQHVVDLASRGLMCTCRPCYLLFTAEGAELRYHAVPERYLSFAEVVMDPRQWDELEIPVGLAFFFANSELGRTVAFYPGPAGATESELPLGAWDRVVDAHPVLRTLAPDVEALIVRMPDRTWGRSRRRPSSSRSTAATSSSGPCGWCGGVSTAARRRGPSSTAFFAAMAARSRPAREDGAGHG